MYLERFWLLYLSRTWIFKIIIEPANLDHNVMEWLSPLPHYVGWIAKLTLMGSPGTLPNIMGRGLTIP
jgi:hypothetical protein